MCLNSATHSVLSVCARAGPTAGRTTPGRRCLRMPSSPRPLCSWTTLGVCSWCFSTTAGLGARVPPVKRKGRWVRRTALWHCSVPCCATRHFPPFLLWCADNVNFAKFCRECPGMLDAHLNKTEVDLIFTKVREKGKRRLSYVQFLDALALMAAVKYPGEDPSVAFSVLLEHHVFQCPASLSSTSSGSPGRSVDLRPRRVSAPPPPRRSAARAAVPSSGDVGRGAPPAAAVAVAAAPAPVLDDPQVPLSFSARTLLQAERAKAAASATAAAAAAAAPGGGPHSGAVPPPPPSKTVRHPSPRTRSSVPTVHSEDIDSILEGVNYVNSPTSAAFEAVAASRCALRCVALRCVALRFGLNTFCCASEFTLSLSLCVCVFVSSRPWLLFAAWPSVPEWSRCRPCRV